MSLFVSLRSTQIHGKPRPKIDNMALVDEHSHKYGSAVLRRD